MRRAVELRVPEFTVHFETNSVVILFSISEKAFVRLNSLLTEDWVYIRERLGRPNSREFVRFWINSWEIQPDIEEIKSGQDHSFRFFNIEERYEPSWIHALTA
jgi:hypothetical protein